MTNPILFPRMRRSVSVYVANYGSKDVTCLDARNTKSHPPKPHRHTIPMPFQPFGLVADKKRRRLYVTDGDEVTVIDTKTRTISNHIQVQTQAAFPALNRTGTRLYVPNFRSDTVSVIDTERDNVTHTIAVGSQPSHAALDAEGRYLYVTNYASGTVSMIDTSTLDLPGNANPVIATIRVDTNPHGVVVDRNNKFVYVACQSAQKMNIIDVGQKKVVAQIAVGNSPDGIAMTPDGKQVWVANTGSNTVSIFDAATRSPLKTISVNSPLEIVMWGAFALVSEGNSDCVAVIDRKTYKQIVAPKVGRLPEGMAVMDF